MYALPAEFFDESEGSLDDFREKEIVTLAKKGLLRTWLNSGFSGRQQAHISPVLTSRMLHKKVIPAW